MNTFINRKEELHFLNGKWLENKPHFIAVYGKRRVGKTELIKQFIKDKDAVYFLADRRTSKDQLEELGQLVGNHFQDELLAKNGFAQWLDVFAYLKLHVKQPFIFAVDEFPYLVENNAWTSSIFQKGWDQYLKDVPVMLILSGSSMAMMEREVLSYQAPLYGRRSGQILVKPMNFSQSREFFPAKNFADFLGVYSLTGGMPTYLLEMSPTASLENNLKSKILDRKEFLFNEVEFIIREELREPRTYLSILKAISWGKTRASEIINETGVDKNALHKYLGVLEQLRLIERETPVTEYNPAKSKKGLYKLSDNFLKVWFQYVYPYKSSLELGDVTESVRVFRSGFSTLCEQTYERVCQELIRQHQDKLFAFEKVGRFWDRNLEIDLVCLNGQSKEILFGECKWSGKPVGTNILDDLVEKSKRVDWNLGDRKEFFVLFSKSGFTDALIKIAKERGDVYLFHQDTLIHLPHMFDHKFFK